MSAHRVLALFLKCCLLVTVGIPLFSFQIAAMKGMEERERGREGERQKRKGKDGARARENEWEAAD